MKVPKQSKRVAGTLGGIRMLVSIIAFVCLVPAMLLGLLSLWLAGSPFTIGTWAIHALLWAMALGAVAFGRALLYKYKSGTDKSRTDKSDTDR